MRAGGGKVRRIGHNRPPGKRHVDRKAGASFGIQMNRGKRSVISASGAASARR